jgi:hypothetical protein
MSATTEIPPRARRRVSGPAALGCLCLALLAGCDSDDEAATPAYTSPPAQTIECPPRPALAQPHASERELSLATRGVFDVYGFRARLEPPIDWAMNPHGSLRFQAYLSNWTFLDPLLVGYRSTGNARYLQRAANIAIDWIDSNPRENPAGGEGTWSGKVTSDRATRLAYMLAAARCPGGLSARTSRELQDSLREHLAILQGPHSAGENNHALYVQLGLAAVAAQLPQLPDVSKLRETAERRFRRVLEGRLADGIWLEHSTSYQFLAIRVVDRFLELPGGSDSKLNADLVRMQRAAAWLTAPDGRHTLFGDSRMLRVPAGIRRLAAEQQGLQAFPRAGFAAVRDGDSHLVVSAGFDNTTHKHADELSFELSEGGRRLIADTGMYHKDPGDIRDFVVSARAHSTLTVDDRTFPISDGTRAYGSGVLATGSGAGWHAILAENRLLADQGVAHERLFVYRPGVALLIVDRARSGAPHTFDRYLQFGPEVSVGPRREGRIDLTASGLSGALYDAPARPRAKLRAAHGEQRPLAGFMSPDYREWQPRTTLRLRSHGAGLTRALSLALDDCRVHVESLNWAPGSVDLTLVEADQPPVKVRVERRGTNLLIRELSGAS